MPITIYVRHLEEGNAVEVAGRIYKELTSFSHVCVGIVLNLYGLIMID